MRILFVSTLPRSWGGSEWLWSGAALMLAREGHHVGFCQHVHNPHPALAELRSAGAKEFVERSPQRWWRRWRHGVRSGATFAAGILAQFKPDLVVVSQAGQHVDPVWTPELILTRTRYSVIVQAVNDAQPLSEREAELGAVFFRGSHRTYFVAHGNQRALERILGERIQRAAIVRNPFRAPYDAPFTWPTAGEELHLGLAARLEPEHKGQDVLFETLAGAAWRERSIWLHLYGTGPAENQLRRTAKMLSLERVVFEGHVDDVKTIWDRCHVVAQPSRQEGMPITVVEGMLCGRPVLGTGIAGIPEFVEDGVTGFLAPACTAELLDAALQRLWSSRTRLPAMGHAAQARARSLVPANPAEVFARELLGSAAS